MNICLCVCVCVLFQVFTDTQHLVEKKVEEACNVVEQKVDYWRKRSEVLDHVSFSPISGNTRKCTPQLDRFFVVKKVCFFRS